MLMHAIRTNRSGLIKLMVKHGADISVTDSKGVSALLLASIRGDRQATTSLLESGAPQDDGSLHHAVRTLNYEVAETLLQSKHSPNHPSAQADGRTPLAELFFAVQASAQNFQIVKKMINLLHRHGGESERPVLRKPLICWALDNSKPVHMVQALLDAYLHEQIDDDFNLYFEDGYCYSPMMYVSKAKFRGPSEATAQLLGLLKCATQDVYYHTLEGPQPPDAVGMPRHIAEAEAARKAHNAKLAAEEEEHRRQIRLRREAEAEAQMLEQQRHDLEIAQAAEKEAAEQSRLQSREASEQKRIQTRHSLRIAMQSEIAEQELVILGDETQLQQVVMNLLNNAHDAVWEVNDPKITLRLAEYIPDNEFRSRHRDLEAAVFARISILDHCCPVKH